MYHLFGGNEIRPEGWLLRQLRIEAEGLCGNLDRIWPDIKDSAWIGGSREGWERVPYWLDGFIPLSYLLEDGDMKRRADLYVGAILDRQQEDGWICPCSLGERKTYDVWAHFLIGKVLALYCTFTDSARAKESLYRSMQCLDRMLRAGEVTLFDWGKFRWFECLIPIRFLYEDCREEWLLELARRLQEQGADYPSYAETWKRPMNQWTFHTHIVNLAMMLKYEAVCCALFKEPYRNRAEELWKVLEQYNGTAVGTFTGDECLSGIANNQGTELCSVVELMYSCELLYAATGDCVWAERLERIAFNALPATLSDDMWTHQYDQMVNQIACIRFPGKPIFRTNGVDAHLFGLEPHFGCCTANFGQGWPKLAMNAFLRDEDGVVCSMLPARLKTVIGDTEVCIVTESEYPFRLSCKYVVRVQKPVRFALKIRVPQWAKQFRVNGRPVDGSGLYTIEKEWSGEETLSVCCTDVPRLVRQRSGLQVAEYGPLVFSLPVRAQYRKLEYEKDGVKRRFPYCDYELLPQSAWRYGFGGGPLTVCMQEGDGVPFSSVSPTVTLKAGLCPVEWDFADGYDSVCAVMPVSGRATGGVEEMQLYPYGCAKLRMTEMPLAIRDDCNSSVFG